MIFEDFISAWQIFLLAGFIIAVILGAVVNKTGFCTMGAVSDWVNMGDTGRFRAWFMAMGVAILGVIIFEQLGLARMLLFHNYVATYHLQQYLQILAQQVQVSNLS